MRSHVLEGRVRHRRLQPFDYALDHAVWYAALDLGELDSVDRRLRLLSRNRRNVLSFRDADHLPAPATAIDADIRAHLAGEGVDAVGWQVVLVTNLRVLGYVFNPASFFLCRDAAGCLRVVVVEVHNTHGERHLYTLRAADDAAATRDRLAAGMAKAFYVSPFLDMEGRYTVQVRDEIGSLTISINERHGDSPMLTTNLVLRRRPLTDRTLLEMLLRHPFVTQRTIGFIHWHAFRLWLKGARFQRHGQAVVQTRPDGTPQPATVAPLPASTPAAGAIPVTPSARKVTR
jgi:DUF1365 family protein